MSIHENALNLLKEIYSVCQEKRAYTLSKANYCNLNSKERIQLDTSMNYLLDLNYVRNYAPSCGFPISCQITAKGIREVEHIISENQSKTSIGTQININGSTNYGVISSVATSNTINTNLSNENLNHLIDDIIKTNKDNEEKIKELLLLLEEKSVHSQDKSTISKIFSHIKDTKDVYISAFNILSKFFNSND